MTFFIWDRIARLNITTHCPLTCSKQKSTNMNRTVLRLSSLLLLIALGSTFMTGCKKDSATTTSTTYTISGTASGNNEVPAVTTSGTGTLTGTYDPSTKILTYSVSWSNLSGPATASHFHGPAPAGQNASVIVPFTITNNGNGGTASGQATLTSAQETDLLAGNWYWNVHTAAHGGGEIRAQVVATR
jgi:CHRD domain